jgi:uncharacterized membrane protein HdeD (DUF308 family)
VSAHNQINRAGSRSSFANGLGIEFPDALVQRLAAGWWIELLLGVFWLAASVVVLRFSHASVVTVGVLTGALLLAFAVEELALAALDQSPTRWLWALFGLLLGAGGIVSLVHPVETFAGLAEILGAIFLVVGIVWLFRAFAERAINGLWWLTLISAILMIVLAFWTSGEFFVERAFTLLIFTGVFALMKGVTDIVRAFQLRTVTGGDTA